MQVVQTRVPLPELTPETFTLDVGGMKCAGCVKTVENQLTQHPGVVSATVNLITEVALVKCQSGAVQPETLAQLLTESGFPSQPRLNQGKLNVADNQKLDPVEQQRQATQQQIQRFTVAATLLLLSTIGHLDHFGWLTVPGLDIIW
ncbi:heavy metal translocating P-type ATPase, partial [filamentous cyanobacterium CCP1]